MRVFVSVDMEGVAGVATLDQVVRGGSGYPRAQLLMTAEANAAVAGAFAGGADEVVVNDSHGTMDNLVAAELDPRARLLLGAPKPSCMVQGLTGADAVALFVGYHAGAGESGVLAHTFSSSFTQVRVNGRAVTEAEVNALSAASLGVPVGLVSGDDAICATAVAVFPGVQAVAVKTHVGFAAAESVHPSVAAERISEGARAAVVAAAAGELAPLPAPAALTLEVDFATPLAADFAASVPGTQRRGGLTTVRPVDTPAELLELISAWYYLAGVAATQFAAIATRR